MRVLQVLGRSAGGIARHVDHISRGLRERTFDVDVAAPVGLPVEIAHRVHDVEIPDDLSVRHLGAVAALVRLARRYDVVHAHGLRAGVDAALAARLARVPCVVTIHNTVQDEIAGRRAALYRRSEALVPVLAHRVLAVSEQIAERIRAAAPRHAHKVETGYLGVGAAPEVRRSRAEARSVLGVPDGDALIVTAARLAPQKALHVMIDAFAELTTPAVLAVFGEGPLETTLRERAGRAGVADRIRFEGFRPDVHDFVAAADVFCLSSLWEGVPLAVQEAILLGTPVVATEVGGMPEIVDDGRTGLLVASGDAGALAAALEDVLGDPERAHRFAEAARRHLAQRFSDEGMFARLIEVYRALAA